MFGISSESLRTRRCTKGEAQPLPVTQHSVCFSERFFYCCHHVKWFVEWWKDDWWLAFTITLDLSNRVTVSRGNKLNKIIVCVLCFVWFLISVFVWVYTYWTLLAQSNADCPHILVILNFPKHCMLDKWVDYTVGLPSINVIYQLEDLFLST